MNSDTINCAADAGGPEPETRPEQKQVSDAIKVALAKAKLKQVDVAAKWNTSKQAVSNKFYRDYWSANELVDLAHITGSRLVFKFPDGTEIPIDTDMPIRSHILK